MGLDDTTIAQAWRENQAPKASTVTQFVKRHGHFVLASGLRWKILMLQEEIPWAQRVWAQTDS